MSNIWTRTCTENAMWRRRAITVMDLQTKACQDRRQTIRAQGEAWTRVSLVALGRNQPCQHLDTGLTDSRTVRQRRFSCLSHLICSALLWQHSIQFSLVAQSCPTLCNPLDWIRPGYPSSTISQSLLKLTSIESVMPSNHLILCRPLLLLISICPSIGVFSNESVLHIRWPKY